MTMKGYPSQDKDNDVGNNFVTVGPKGAKQFGLDVLAHQFVRVVATDAVEAGSSTTQIVATGHSALRGDVIYFTSGALSGRSVSVHAIPDANTITLVESLPSAPVAAVTFEILRHGYPVIDAAGRVTVDATITEAATAADGAGAQPAVVKVIGGWDGTNVQTLSTDNTGRLNVNATMTEAATAADGAAAPAVVKVAGGVDGGGNTQALHTDTDGDLQVDILSSALPTGAATAARQDTGNTSLASIDGKLGTLGQKNMAGSAPVVIASDQSAVPVADGGGSLTVDSPQLPATLGQKTMANSAAVTIASDQSALNVNPPARIESTNNSLTNAALASLDLEEGVYENVEAYQTAEITMLSTQDMIVDIYQSNDGLGQVSDEAYTVLASTPFRVETKLYGKQLKVGVNNIGGGAANYTLKTYLNKSGNSFPSGVVDTSTLGTSYYARLRTQSDQLPSALGQQNMAGSVSVAIASNQSAVPVSVSSEPATAADGGALPATTKVVSGYDGANVQALSTDTSGRARIINQSQLVPFVYDYISYSEPSSTTEEYVYKTGGSGGATVATVTITYTSAAKTTLSSIART